MPKEGIRQRKTESAWSREEDKVLWRTRGVCSPLNQLDWQEKRSERRESGRKRAEKG